MIEMLKQELNWLIISYNVAKIKAEHDPPHIQVEVSRLENVVNKLTSNDKEDILSRYRGFLFTSVTG